ncbi:unnamed protein product (mitochondrion) [Plasmodiophora brassicae]|uniref:FYVE-type domain-containing protein n=1 Tax=Plasmodiophora brassicae TaxID=37360 RepID=A0A3P3Y0U3_PLABS|nr:unnamed protein product [Plasmodiophora brassicae]
MASSSSSSSSAPWKLLPADQVACALCSAPFTLFTRRHHCRACGLVVCAACSRGRRPVAADASARVCDKCRCRFELVDRGVDVDLLICFIVQQCSMLADVDALKRLHVERIDTVGALRDDADVFVHLRPVPARPADVAVDVLDRARAGDLCASWSHELHHLRRAGAVFAFLEMVSDTRVWMRRLFAVTNNGDLAVSNIDCQDPSNPTEDALAVRFIRPISLVRSLYTKKVVLSEASRFMPEVVGRAVCVKWGDEDSTRKDTVLVVTGSTDRDMERNQKELLETVRVHVDLFVERKRRRTQEMSRRRSQMSVPVSWDHPEHASLLGRLWRALKPDDHFPGSKSERWSEIGFQGKDPQTDFRGTGFLGLLCLVYWSETLGAVAQEMVHQHRHYPVCTAAINLVQMLDDLIGELPSASELGSEMLLVLCHQDAPEEEAFEQMFCALLMRFDRLFVGMQARHPFCYATLHRWLADV